MAKGTEVGKIHLGLGIDTGVLTKQLDDLISISTKKVTEGFSDISKDATNKLGNIGKDASKSAAENIRKSFEGIETTADKAGNNISRILSDEEKTQKSKGASIASIYKKQGMNSADAFKKAWEQIERSTKATSDTIKKHSNDTTSAVKKNVDSTEKYTKKKLTSMGGSVSSVSSKIKKTLFAGLSTVAITSFTKSCIDMGSNLVEVQNVVDTAFGNMSGQADIWASSAMENFGLSETAAKKYLGVFGQMSSAMGVTGQAALDMSQQVAGLTGDVASFYNLSANEAYTKLKSIWTGETESLKDLGVIMTQTNLDQYALNNGFGKTTEKMTEQEKLMLRFQYVTTALSNASGDFIKTQDSWANQTRILSLRFDQLRASLGKGFIALFTPILRGLNNLLAGLQKVADGFADFVQMLTGADISVSTGVISENISGIGEDAATAAGNVAGIGSAASDAAKEIEKSLAGFDKITKLSEPTDNSSGTSSDNSDISGGISSGVAAGASNASDEVNKFSQKMLAALEPLKSIRFDNLINSFGELKEAVSPLTDKLFDGLKWGYDEILVPLAKWSIEDALPAFLDLLSEALSVLNGVLDELQPTWDLMWNNLFKPLAEWTGKLAVDSMKDISAVLKAIGENEKACDVVVSLGAALLGFKTGSVLYEGISNIGLLKKKLSAISTIGKIGIAIGVAVTGFEVGNWLYQLMTGDKTDYDLNDYIGVNFDSQEWIDALSMCWDDLCSWCETNIAAPVGEFAHGLWIKITDPFIDIGAWLKEKFSTAWQGVKDSFNSAGEFAHQLWTKITSPFVNIAGWFREKFSDAWQKVKDVFSTGGRIFDGIKDGILSGLKGIVNGLIRGINKVISVPFDGINSALNGIRKVNIMGVKPFSWMPTIKTPQIPMLAQGGYVKANTPQLAMIGDNRHQGEVVAPEDKLRQMAMEAAQMSAGGALMAEAITIMKQILKVLKDLDLDIQIDGMSLKKYIVNKINENTKATGKCEIIT